MKRASVEAVMEGRSLENDAEMAAARGEYEEALDEVLAGIVETFLGEVIEDGVAAMSSATLVAAGAQPEAEMPGRDKAGRFVADPFSYTQVMKRWYSGVRQLADLTDLSEEQVRVITDGSDLPSWAFDDVRDTLLRSREEGWTTYKTKRGLSAILIPKESSGRWDSRAKYRAAVRRIARTLSTENFNLRVTGTLATLGYEFKEWVSRHDDRVRHTHAVADGQKVRLQDRFIVGLSRMLYPGDPLGGIEETANCRCVVVGARAPKKGRKMSRKKRDENGLTAAAVEDEIQVAKIDQYATPTATLAEDEQELVDEAAEEVVEEVEAEPEDEGPELALWHGVIGMEKTMTGDGRLIEDGALRWEDLPIPLRYVASDVGAHDGAQVVGTIQHIEREEDGRITATGTFDTTSEVGREAMRQVAEGLTNGVSMDLDDVSFEVRVAEDVVAALEGSAEGEEDPEGEDGTAQARVDADGRVVMFEMASDDEVHVTTSARIRAATIVSIPAFAEAKIEVLDDADALSDEEAVGLLDEDDVIEGDDIEETYNWVDDVGGLPKYIRRIADHLIAQGIPEGRAIASAVNTVKRWARGGTVRANGGPRVSAKTAAKAAAAVAEWEAKKIRAKASSAQSEALALVAAGGPLAPPSAWFEDPKLPGPTALTITEDGRVFGHLAIWDSCHIAHPDDCVSPPQSRSGYAYFHTGAVLTSDGEEIPVGHLTMNTGHAAASKDGAGALAHYDHTGTVAADVRAGEDAYGIWVAGAMRPGLKDEQVRSMRSAPLSGDWRRVGGSLELVAALAVNVPGFPVPRPSGRRSRGHVQALVASGMVPPKKVKRPGTEGALSERDLRYLKALARREKRAHAETMARKIREEKIRAMAARLQP